MGRQENSLLKQLKRTLQDWPLARQLAGHDPLAQAAESKLSRRLRPRLEEADTVGTSICPYCAVGCAQLIYAKGNAVIQVEGDPAAPSIREPSAPRARRRWA